MEKLIEFLKAELSSRGWSHRELARRAGVSPTSVSGTINSHRPAGSDFCKKIATALDVPPERVLRIAGLLPAVPDENSDTRAIIDMLHNMTALQQRDVLVFVKFIYSISNSYARSGFGNPDQNQRQAWQSNWQSDESELELAASYFE